jgi:hypothetical protein
VFGYFALLVECRVFEEVRLKRLLPGHTKGRCDRSYVRTHALSDVNCERSHSCACTRCFSVSMRRLRAHSYI